MQVTAKHFLFGDRARARWTAILVRELALGKEQRPGYRPGLLTYLCSSGSNQLTRKSVERNAARMLMDGHPI